MSRVKVVMPQMGESITNGTITKWHKSPGDEIAVDEILLEISTDKVESEIPSPVKGRVETLLYEEGETIDVGELIAEIENDLSVPFSGDSGGSAPAKTESEAPAPAKEESTPATAAPASTPAETSGSSERRFYTPLVKAMASEAGIPLSELDQVQGSGAGGRVNKKDFLNYLENRGEMKAKSGTSSASTSTASSVPSGARVEVIPMDNMRKAIANNMVASKMTSPHVNSIDEIDMTPLFKFREGMKHEFKKEEGFSLTYTHFILYAIIQALKEHPMVNASIDGDNIVLKKDINLGCAVAVPGNGLIVPVVHNADSLNLRGLARKINDLAQKARAKSLTMDEISGGTFTFTNVGSFGTLAATPVILQPQLGIFAAGVIKKRPIVTSDDAIAIRQMMYGTHTYDHRLIDGELGGKFLATVKQNLETMDPSGLL